MIIKTFARKSPNFPQLIHYITQDRPHNQQPLRFFQCLPSQEIASIIQAFQENDSYRIPRKNGNACYHSILSFHTLDNAFITPNILYDLIRQYIQLRAPHTPCFAQSHHDKEHVHIHVLIAGNQYKSTQTTRQSRKEFYQLRVTLEQYQQKHYPQLQHSLVYERMRTFPKRKLQQTLLRAYDKAENEVQFFQFLHRALPNMLSIDKKHQLLSYQNQHYNFSDFGIDLELFKRLQELHQIDRAFAKGPSRER